MVEASLGAAGPPGSGPGGSRALSEQEWTATTEIDSSRGPPACSGKVQQSETRGAQRSSRAR